MSRTRTLSTCSFFRSTLMLLAMAGLALAQDPRGWRRMGDPAPNQPADPSNAAATPGNWQDQAGDPPQQSAPPAYQGEPGAPARITIRPGTYLTVHINQPLSSDHNQPGDAFSASLARPLVVDGIVVAQTGQTVGGHVVEAQKAGRVTGTSRLKIQLTDLTLVDGQQLPIHSQMVTRSGPTSEGRDAAAIAGTTAMGAAIGAAADWGRGAAIGAGAGAAAGIIGVLLTRGAPTVVYPESVLTFRIEAPVTVSTDRAPQAFRYVEPGDYDRANQPQVAQGPPRMYAPGPAGPPPPPYYYPYYGPYFGYPAYWGNFGIYWGPRYYGGGYRVYRH
jgi:hypothetical protein